MFDPYEDEQWSDIPGYPNYEISNCGRVWNIRHDRQLKPFNDKDGYQIVSLFYYNKRTDFKVHRLVADVFLSHNSESIEVNHDDGDKSYNYVENLEWTTHEENMNHAFRTGLSIRRAIRIIETNEVFESIIDCSRSIGGSSSGICNYLSGLRNSHRGFTFEYVD
jgi:NUMOD4 motif